MIFRMQFKPGLQGLQVTQAIGQIPVSRKGAGAGINEHLVSHLTMGVKN
jgi:hypothetical protein